MYHNAGQQNIKKNSNLSYLNSDGIGKRTKWKEGCKYFIYVLFKDAVCY